MQLFKFLKKFLLIKMQLNFHFDKKKNWLFSTQPAGSNEHETEWSQNSKIDNVKYFITLILFLQENGHEFPGFQEPVRNSRVKEAKEQKN
jgi:hypothetical protein